jgi:prophage regulatory protein
MDYKLIREPQVLSLTGLSKTTRWRLERDGKFPKKRQLSANTVAWMFSEIEAWIQTRDIVETKVSDKVTNKVTDKIVNKVTEEIANNVIK